MRLHIHTSTLLQVFATILVMYTLLAVNLKNSLYGGGVDRGITSVGGLLGWIDKILPNAYMLAGVILFIYLIIGGFILVTSGGNPQNAQQGQKVMMNAIIGFVIIITSYWIIQIIEFVTGVNVLDPPGALFPI